MNDELEAALAALLDRWGSDALARDARRVSERYRTQTGTGRRLLTGESEAAAYAASRMPATLAAAKAALAWSLEASGLSPATLLDCGAGTGAVSFAASELLELTHVVCMEREAAMRETGRRLMALGSEALQRAEWLEADLAGDSPLPRAELVCEGYMLGELAAARRVGAARRMFEAAEQMLLLIEPGTPQGGGEPRRRARGARQGGRVCRRTLSGGRGGLPDGGGGLVSLRRARAEDAPAQGAQGRSGPV